jgi:hypothetical protein
LGVDVKELIRSKTEIKWTKILNIKMMILQ